MDAKKGNTTSGIYPAMPAEEYHALDALSASGAKDLLRSPAHWLARRETPMKPSPAMAFGTLVHALILEPDRVHHLYAVAEKFDRRTTAGKLAFANFEAANAGKTIVELYDFQRAQRVRDSVMAHKVAAALLSTGGATELSLRWDMTSAVPRKARLDYYFEGRIVDLKTARDASPAGFARAVAQYQYHVQVAHYLAGIEATHGWEPDDFTFIAVEPESPFSVGVYQIDGPSIAAGKRLLDLAAAAYLTAHASGAWLGYEREIVTLGLPAWALGREDGE